MGAHNHQHCIDEALHKAERVCHASGGRLTLLRRRVLEMIWGDHRPVGAYALLDRLRAEGRKAQPPTIYRALDFLLEHGLVHRVASLNAFIGCPCPGHDGGGLLICRDCGRIDELHDPKIAAALRAGARQQGYRIELMMLELSGQCADCARGQT